MKNSIRPTTKKEIQAFDKKYPQFKMWQSIQPKFSDKQFTKDGVVELLRDVVSSCWGSNFDDIQKYFNKFLLDHGFEIENNGKILEYKQFTEGDMMDFAVYAICCRAPEIYHQEPKPVRLEDWLKQRK